MPIKAAVIGDPISHSLSPKIHNSLLKKYDINGSYEAILVKKNDLKFTIDEMKKNGFAGFNITIPHKEEVFRICDYKSKTAKLTGAVNTVVITEDKKLFGHNSDVDGFLNNLKNSHPNFELNNKNAFVVGAGGAARAIVYGLIKSGVKKIFITNRSQERAEELIKNFSKFSSERKCALECLDEKSFSEKLDKCDFLVNSSSLGMSGQMPLSLDLTKLKKGAMVYDIVYKPLMTELLKSAQDKGNNITTGIGMLVFQALIGFELWFKVKPEIDEHFIKMIAEQLYTGG